MRCSLRFNIGPPALEYIHQSTYTIKETLEEMLKSLETETLIVLNWFKINEMKSNDNKYQLRIANHDNCSVRLVNEIIERTNTVKLLGIKIDNELKFTVHVSYLCKKVIKNYTPLFSQQKKLIMKIVIDSQNGHGKNGHAYRKSCHGKNWPHKKWARKN